MIRLPSRIAVLILTVVLGGGAPAFIRVCAAQAASTTIKWHDALRQKHEWYGGDEATRIADNLLVYQRGSSQLLLSHNVCDGFRAQHHLNTWDGAGDDQNSDNRRNTSSHNRQLKSKQDCSCREAAMTQVSANNGSFSLHRRTSSRAHYQVGNSRRE